MRQLRRPIAFLLLAWFLPACSTYRTTDLTPHEAIAGQETVMVTLADVESTEVTVRFPCVRADSLGGVVERDPWSVPLSSVAEVRTKRLDGWLTVTVVGLSLIPVFVLGASVASKAGA